MMTTGDDDDDMRSRRLRRCGGGLVGPAIILIFLLAMVVSMITHSCPPTKPPLPFIPRLVAVAATEDGAGAQVRAREMTVERRRRNAEAAAGVFGAGGERRQRQQQSEERSSSGGGGGDDDESSSTYDPARDLGVNWTQEDDDKAGLSITQEGGLLVLNQDNFHAALERHGALLIVLYAPWCDHSQPLLDRLGLASHYLQWWEGGQRHDDPKGGFPRYDYVDVDEEWRRTYQPHHVEPPPKEDDGEEDDGPPPPPPPFRPGVLPDGLDLRLRPAPRIAKIDATVETELAEIFHISGYPTLKLVLRSSSTSTDDGEGGEEGGGADDGGGGPSPGAEADALCFFDARHTWHCPRDRDARYSVIEYDGHEKKAAHDVFSFVLHHWARQPPSPVFRVADGSLGAQQFLTWVERNDLNPPTWNRSMGRFSSWESVVFFQCQDGGGGGGGAAEATTCVGDRDDECHPVPSERDDDVERQGLLLRRAMDEFRSLAASYRARRQIFFVGVGSNCGALGMEPSTGQVRVVVTPSSARFKGRGDDGDGDGNGEEDDSDGGNGDSVGADDGEVIMNNNDIPHDIYDPRTAADAADAANDGGPFTSLSDFVRLHSIPLLVYFNREDLSVAFGPDRLVHVSLYVEHCDAVYAEKGGEAERRTEGAGYAFRRAAVRHRDAGFVFLVIPSDEDRIVDYFGIESFPSVMITDMRGGGMRKFLLGPEGIGLVDEDDDESSSSIARFVGDFRSGRLRPVLKSEAISDEDDRGIVKVVRALSFDSMVMQSQRHSLVNFFAPFCGHSKRLGPTWTELANLMKFLRSDVDVMKMDATENDVDHPGVDIDAFPTVYLFPKGNKTNPLRYDGRWVGADANDFVSWLFRHGLRKEEEEMIRDGRMEM